MRKQDGRSPAFSFCWIPAFAGMSGRRETVRVSGAPSAHFVGVKSILLTPRERGRNRSSLPTGASSPACGGSVSEADDGGIFVTNGTRLRPSPGAGYDRNLTPGPPPFSIRLMVFGVTSASAASSRTPIFSAALAILSCSGLTASAAHPDRPHFQG